MATQTPHAPPVEKRQASVRSIIVLLFVVALTIFAVMNRHTVPVWLIKGLNMPLFLVIFLSFIMGAVIGWLVKGIQTARFYRNLRSE